MSRLEKVSRTLRGALAKVSVGLSVSFGFLGSAAFAIYQQHALVMWMWMLLAVRPYLLG